MGSEEGIGGKGCPERDRGGICGSRGLGLWCEVSIVRSWEGKEKEGRGGR